MSNAQRIPISTPTSHNDDIRTAHANLVVRLSAIRAPRLWLEPDQSDMEDYGTYMRTVLEHVKEFHAQVCGFVAMNGAGNIDDVIRMGDASLTDMQADFEGSVNSAAEELGHRI